MFSLLLSSFAIISLTVTLFAYSKRAVLVTGANKGIGKAICEKILSTQSDTQVFLGSRDKERGAAAVSSIVASLGESVQGRINTVVLDVTLDSSVDAAAAQIKEMLGNEPLYGLVNNAGVGFGRGVSVTLAANYFGTKRVTDKFLPMLDKSEGRIVNIASASGPNFVRECGKKTKSFT